MSSEEYLDKMKKIQEQLLLFIDDEKNTEENFQNLKDIFINTKIKDNRYELVSLLHLILQIGNYHYRFNNFFSKLEQIITFFKEDIKNYYSNSEIFNIFKSNKRILLFLVEEQIMIIDSNIAKKFITKEEYIEAKYPHYFYPEIIPFENEQFFPIYIEDRYPYNKNKWITELKEELPKDFYEQRKKGENDDKICEIIRNDDIKEFQNYTNQNKISLDSKINKSIYETNPFLILKRGSNFLLNKSSNISLIEYASFFGSIQIFNYLKNNDVNLTSSLWPMAIHSQNLEIIHILEENNVKIKDDNCKKNFYDSLKCFTNDMANYFFKKYLNNENDNENIIKKSLKYYNFNFLKNEFINESSFCFLCKYDYSILVEYLLKNKCILDINKEITVNKYRKTAFIIAVENENIDIIKLLLTNENVDINKSGDISYDDQTPLFYAVEIENIEIIHLLLSNDKIDINIRISVYPGNGQDFKTPFYYAVEKGNIEIIKLFLNNENFDIDFLSKEFRCPGDRTGHGYYKTPFCLAVEKGYIDIVKLFLENGRNDVNAINKHYDEYRYKYITGKGYKTAFYVAVENKKTDIVKLLLKNEKVDINAINEEYYDDYGYCSGKTPLYLAIQKGYNEIVKILLKNEKTDVNFLNLETNKYIKSYEEEEEKNDDDLARKTKKTALYLAVENKNIEVINLLLENEKVDINILNKEYKCKKSKYSCMCNEGSWDPDNDVDENYTDIIQDEKMKSVLHLAVQNEYIYIIKLLLKRKDIDIDVKDEQGKRPVDYTTNKKIIKMLNVYSDQKKIEKRHCILQ